MNFREIGRINREKVVFLAATAWLLYTGIRFQVVPEVPEWGPPRTYETVPECDPFHIRPGPQPKGGGGEGGGPDGAEARVDDGQPDTPFGGRDRQGTDREGGRAAGGEVDGEQDDSDSGDSGSANGERPRRALTAGDLLRDAGRIRGRGSEQYVILETKTDGGFVRLREGDTIPARGSPAAAGSRAAAGFRVIAVTKSFVVVEDRSGRRYRLYDLLRAGTRGRE